MRIKLSFLMCILLLYLLFPARFKALLYFPKTETFRISRIYEKYAFDSYFKADLAKTGEIVLHNSYDYSREVSGAFKEV